MLEQGLDAPPVTYIDADINAYTAKRVTKETKKAEEQAAPITANFYFSNSRRASHEI